MNAFRCLNAVARPTATSATTLLRPSIQRISASQPKIATPSTTRALSLLTPRRPVLSSSPSFAAPSPSMAPSCTPTSPTMAIPGAEALDLMPKVSSHPALGAMQIRCGPRDTYNPSHLVRKRRHGFLTRLKSKKGRKLLMRRIKKGRVNLSH